MYLKDPKISRKEMCHQICDLALGEGKTLNKDGKPITKRKEQEAVLAEQVDLFREHTLQLMSTLAVI